MSTEETPLRPSLNELKSICKTLLRLAPALDRGVYVKLIEVGVERHERLGYMLSHVAACIALCDGLSGKETRPETQQMLVNTLTPDVPVSIAIEALQALKTALLVRLRELYPHLNIQGMLRTPQKELSD